MLFGKAAVSLRPLHDEFSGVPRFWMLSARDSIQKLMVRRLQSKQPDKHSLSG